MMDLLSLKKDFYRKLFNNLQKNIFSTDYSLITGYKALNFFLNIKEKIPKEIKTVAIICDQSIDNLIICFFFILSEYEIILLSNDQNKKDIFDSLDKNKCKILIAEKSFFPEFNQEKNDFQIINYDLVNEFKESEKTDLKTINRNFDDLIIGKTIFMSSGSTAKPKIIPLSYKNINNCYQNVLKGFLSSLDFNQIICVHDSSFVIVLPFLFAFASNKESVIYGLERKRVNLSLLSATKEIVNKKTKNLIISVPSVYKTILKIIQDKNDDKLSNTNVITCGEPLDKNLALSIFKNKPLSFFNLYGSTEVSPWILSLNINKYIKDNETKIPSIIPAGIPLPNTDLLLYKNQELIVSSEAVFEGYLHYNKNQPFLNLDGKKFFRTGDKFSECDNLYFCEGRLSGAIKVAGRFINPVIIEAALRCELELSEVLLIPHQNSPKITINVFSHDLENKENEVQKVKKILIDYVSSKIDSEIKFHRQEAKKLRSGKIDRKFYIDQFNRN